MQLHKSIFPKVNPHLSQSEIDQINKTIFLVMNVDACSHVQMFYHWRMMQRPENID